MPLRPNSSHFFTPVRHAKRDEIMAAERVDDIKAMVGLARRARACSLWCAL